MKRHSLDLVVVVALFCIYTSCALLLCVIGAEVYRGTAQTMQRNYDERTSVLYIAEKLRQNDRDGTVRVEEFEGNDALVLTEKNSGRDFETWLFVSDNLLYEGTFAPGVTPDIKLCQPIMPMKALTLKITGSDGVSDNGDSGLNGGISGGRRLEVSFTTVNGQTTDIDLWLRSRREGAGS